MSDLLVVRLQTLDHTGDAEVVIPFGAVQGSEREDMDDLYSYTVV